MGCSHHIRLRGWTTNQTTGASTIETRRACQEFLTFSSAIATTCAGRKSLQDEVGYRAEYAKTFRRPFSQCSGKSKKLVGTTKTQKTYPQNSYGSIDIMDDCLPPIRGRPTDTGSPLYGGQRRQHRQCPRQINRRCDRRVPFVRRYVFCPSVRCRGNKFHRPSAQLHGRQYGY